MNTPESIVGLSIIVPVYNEEDAVQPVLEELKKIAEELPVPYEIIAINDGSSDRTGSILAAISDIRVITHALNRGYGASLKTGVQQAQYERVLITDADGTYPNHRISEFYQESLQCDMVVGARTTDNVSIPLIRGFAKDCLRRYSQWIVKTPIPDLNSGFRIIRKDLIKRFFGILPDGFSFTTTITLASMRNHYQVTYIPIDYEDRIGKSKIKPIRDTASFIQLITRCGMYFAPLRILLPLAAAMFALSGASFFYDLFVIHNLTDKTIVFLLFAFNFLVFALLADMIQKNRDF